MKNYTLRIATGLIIILIGTAFLLNNLNILTLGSLMGAWWPLLIVAAGLIILFNNSRHYLWALLVIGLGVVFQLNTLGYIDVNPWQLLWPAIIIVVGLSIMTSHVRSIKRGKGGDNLDNATAILGGSTKKITSSDFQGGDVTILFGGMKLDLTQAVIKKEANLRITSICGGVEIIKPKNLVIKNELSPILGGVEDSTENVKSNSPVLYLTGDLIMSGVEIKTLN